MELSNNKYVFKLSWLTLVPHILGMALVVGAFTTPIQILKILTTKIEIDGNMLYGKIGILKRDIQNSPIKHVQSVRVDRSLFGRILGYGNVRITTAGDGFYYKGIANPEKLRRVLNNHM